MKPPNFSLTDLKEENFPTAFMRYIDEVRKTLLNISFGDGKNSSENRNIDALVVSGSLPLADTEVGFDHSLGRVPIGIICLSLTKAAVLYDGVTANTSSKIYLRANLTPVDFKVLIF